jgi:large subunit ribosomal protein L15
MRAKHPEQKKAKKIGRGPASGHGKTSTRGHKGQGARAGFSMSPGFEGGQTPLYRRVGKRGFHNPNQKTYTVLNLDQLSRCEMSEVTPKRLVEQGIIKKLRDGLKVLGRGVLDKKVSVQAHAFSQSAKQAIEKSGGRAVVIGREKKAA